MDALDMRWIFGRVRSIGFSNRVNYSSGKAGFILRKQALRAKTGRYTSKGAKSFLVPSGRALPNRYGKFKYANSPNNFLAASS